MSHIDFDLKFNDQNKILFLVKNLLPDSNYASRMYECDSFNDNECHHLSNHHLNETFDLNQNQICSKCSYCQFYDLLYFKHSHLKISSDLYKLPNNYRHYVNVRYKKRDYPIEMLEWCEFQPYKSPYVLIAYASCYSQADLYNCVNNFEKEKSKYKKTLITSKLFIDLHIKHEMNEDFQKSINRNLDVSKNNFENSFEMSSDGGGSKSILNLDSLSLRNSTFEDDSVSIQESNGKDVENKSNSLTDFINNSNNSDFVQDTKTTNYSLELNVGSNLALNEQQSIPIKQQEPEIKINENELNSRLKALEKDLVYLDFLFAKNGTDRLGVILETEKSKIASALEDCANQVFKKLTYLTKVINATDENQLNYYSEYLKSPIERTERVKTSQSTLTTTSFLSIKMINKKTVSARMNKHKADLFLIVNIVDAALYHYSQANSLAKKENDFVWAFSAVEGLCIASYLLTNENKHSPLKQILSDPTNSTSDQSSTLMQLSVPSLATSVSSSSLKSQALKDFRHNFKKTFLTSNKDISQTIIPIQDFGKNYYNIISNYYKSDLTRFICLEVTIMIAKFFIEINLRTDALNFINYAVYISNLQVREETRIRRYLEIGMLYERIEMVHLATFYKWISAGRIFRLIDQTKSSNQNPYFKCILKRCIQQMISLFNSLKINPQKYLSSTNPNELKLTESGFPLAKKQIIIQLIQLFRYDTNFYQSIKFVKYLIHENFDYLSDNELKYYAEFLSTNLNNEKDIDFNIDDEYFTKFYRFPLINTFKIINPKSDLNRTSKIKNTVDATTSIYIYRYESQLLYQKKKITYNLPINHVNKIEINFSNPMPFDLQIDFIDLIAEAKDEKGENFSFKIELFTLVNNEKKRQVNLDPKIKDFKVEMGFICDKLEKFQIIGYEICSLKCKHKILFSEIASADTKEKIRNLTLKAQDLIQSSYDIEIVPKLPIIKDVYFYSMAKLNLEKTEPTFKIFQSKNLTINSNLGTCENYEIGFQLEYETEEMEIIDINLNIINEQIANKLKCKVSIRENNKKYYLEIDSTNFCSDSLENETELDLNCLFEIKFTNKSGYEKNQCNIFKIQMLVKFVQLATFSLANINDLDKNTFEIVILVKNRLNKDLYLSKDNDQVKLEHLAEIEIKKALDKFNLNDLLKDKNDNECFNSITSELINKSVDIKISSFENKSEINKNFLTCLKFNQNKTNFSNYLNKIYKYPIELVAKLDRKSLNSNSENLDFNFLSFYSIMFVFLNKLENKPSNSDYYFVANINKKIENFVLSKEYNWVLQDLEVNYWSKEINILVKKDQDLKTETKNHFCINFYLKNKNLKKSSLMKWSFDYDLVSNKFSNIKN